MQNNKFDNFNLEETLSRLGSTINDMGLLAKRLSQIIPQVMAGKFDELIDSGVLSEVESLVRDTEIDDLEVMTEGGSQKDMTGDRIWAVMNNYMTFPKGTNAELTGPFSNGNFTVTIDFSGANMTGQMVMIAIDPDDLKTDELGFRASLLGVIWRALVKKFTDFDRLDEELEELTFEYLVLEHELAPESAVSKVDQEISFLADYTKLFDPTPKESFLRTTVCQRPEIKIKTLLSFFQYIEIMAFTDFWRNVSHLLIAEEDKGLIRSKLSDRGHYLIIDSPLLNPANSINITVHTLDNHRAKEGFIKSYKALIGGSIKALFFPAERGEHECD